MTKKDSRVAVPKAIRDVLLREFNHRCAICGSDRPHVHHIDEDPTNNDPLNLLPLCPNCHLRDQHDPTAPMDPARLRLFREYRDPMILHERFQPIWARCRFLLRIDDLSREDLGAAAQELIQFVEALEMGKFYGKRLQDLLSEPSHPHVWSTDTHQEDFDRWEREETAEYRVLLNGSRTAALRLIVEMLRYQNWPTRTPGAGG